MALDLDDNHNVRYFCAIIVATYNYCSENRDSWPNPDEIRWSPMALDLGGNHNVRYFCAIIVVTSNYCSENRDKFARQRAANRIGEGGRNLDEFEKIAETPT